MEGRKRKGRSGTDVFESSHMITALIYLLDHDGCRKTDLYGAADRSCLMPKKLVILQDAGMVTLVTHPGMTTIHLTDRGRKVAEHFAEVAAIMGPDRRMRMVRVPALLHSHTDPIDTAGIAFSGTSRPVAEVLYRRRSNRLDGVDVPKLEEKAIGFPREAVFG